MINIDTRLLDDVSCDHFWLLCHIVKRADANLACYPSNKTLCVDTGWNIKKLQRIKSELIERGLLISKPRIGKEEKQSSNWYSIRTDLMGVYVPAKSLSVTLQDTPKTDTLPEKGIRPPTPKTDNEVLTSSEVLSTESKDSVSQKPLTSDTIDLSIESEKKTTIAETKKSCYPEFVKFWCEAYPELGFDATSGNKIKSLINRTVEIVKLNSGDLTEQKINGVFQYILNYVKTSNHWVHGKSITVLDAKYREIYREIKQGKPIQRANPSSSQVFGKYSNSNI